MTTPPEQIVVSCPKCGHEFKTWFRASMNLSLDHFSDRYIEKMSTARCPSCRLKFDLGALVVDPNNVWHVTPVEKKRKDHQKSGLAGELFVAAELDQTTFSEPVHVLVRSLG